ncbi:MAG: hypothetical protein GX561_14600 [Lentisphaerae bacterium]|nr:hypothetical protein [Lentisphaerota bacterium]
MGTRGARTQALSPLKRRYWGVPRQVGRADLRCFGARLVQVRAPGVLVLKRCRR